MIAVYHKPHQRHGRRWRAWKYRNLLCAALLTFCAVQAFVVFSYYNRITAAKDRGRQAAAAAASGSRSLHGSSGAAAAGAAAAPPPPKRKFISRKAQEQALLRGSNYDEKRVQRLQRALDVAAQHLAKGVPPPVQGTSVFPPGNEDGLCIGEGPPPRGAVAAVVVVTFNRAKYLEQMLASLFAVHGRSRANRWKFPLYLSQDMNPANVNASGVQDVAAQHLDRLSFLQHLEAAPPVTQDKKEKPVYYRIANHYKFILRTFFDCFGYERLIILEDDMQLSPDFFSYFEAAAPILDADDSLMCVSSWNDHGQDRFVKNATQLYRSDFFPGLGWMLNKRVWHSVRDAWPKGYWDDYMRLNTTRRERQCIRPEVCRTYNFGDIGSSSGQYFRLFLKPIKLNEEDVRWDRMDLSYLQKDAYARLFVAELAAATPLASVDEVPKAAPGRDYVLRFTSQQHYEQLTGRLRMLREWRDGVPRGAYNGTVAIRNLEGARIFLAPTDDVDFTAAAYDPEHKTRVDSTGAIIRRRPVVSKGGKDAPSSGGTLTLADLLAKRREEREKQRAQQAAGQQQQQAPAKRTHAPDLQQQQQQQQQQQEQHAPGEQTHAPGERAPEQQEQQPRAPDEQAPGRQALAQQEPGQQQQQQQRVPDEHAPDQQAPRSGGAEAAPQAAASSSLAPQLVAGGNAAPMHQPDHAPV